MLPCCPADELQILSLALKSPSWYTPTGSSLNSLQLGFRPLGAACSCQHTMFTFAYDVPSMWNAFCYCIHWGGSYLSLRTLLQLVLLWKPWHTPGSCRVPPPIPLAFLYSVSLVLTFLPDRKLLKVRPAFPLLSPLPSLGHTGRYLGNRG